MGEGPGTAAGPFLRTQAEAQGSLPLPVCSPNLVRLRSAGPIGRHGCSSWTWLVFSQEPCFPCTLPRASALFEIRGVAVPVGTLSPVNSPALPS